MQPAVCRLLLSTNAAAGVDPARLPCRDTAPHHGVHPVVTPPDWRCTFRKKRWLLEVPLKSLWTEAVSRQEHAGLALFLVNTIEKLAKEGWELDGALQGVLYLSRPQGDRLEVRRTRAVTAALAFGVLPEIRTVPRRPPGERAAKVRCMACMHWCITLRIVRAGEPLPARPKPCMPGWLIRALPSSHLKHATEHTSAVACQSAEADYKGHL